MRFLIVDDDRIIRELLFEMFSHLADEIDLAPDCKTALEYLRINQYDLLTLDLSLPDGFGLDILAEIRSDNSFLGKVVIISGDADKPENVSLASELQASAIFVKPFSWEKLMFAVSALLTEDPASQLL